MTIHGDPGKVTLPTPVINDRFRLDPGTSNRSR
jgi:hypothetical protein